LPAIAARGPGKRICRHPRHRIVGSPVPKILLLLDEFGRCIVGARDKPFPKDNLYAQDPVPVASDAERPLPDAWWPIAGRPEG
jgi:hypothetical protein